MDDAIDGNSAQVLTRLRAAAKPSAS